MQRQQDISTRRRRQWVRATTVIGLALGLGACGSDNNDRFGQPDIAPGTIVYGIRGDAELVKFNRDEPDVVASIGTVVVSSDERVIGLDFRPSDGALHAVTSTGRSLILDPDTAMATVIQPITGTGTALTGARFGVDFNPAANALRIIGDDGQNLRVPTAALVSPAPAMAVDTLVDGRMGYLQGVTAAAYTNQDPGATGTTLFVIDTDNDRLYTQDANNGPMTLVGNLGVDATAANGYDIVQVGSDNEHYALLTVGTTTRLYGLNATTGVATAIGDALPAGTYKGLVVEEGGTADERVVLALREIGLGSYATDGYLLNIAAGTVTAEDSFPLVGLPMGEELIGFDRRTTSMDGAEKNVEYAVAKSGAIYSIDEDPMNPSQDLATPIGTLATALSGNSFGVDFNPRADLLRIVSDSGQNLRVNLQLDRAISCRDGVSAARAVGFACVDGTTRLVSPAPQIVATAYRAAPVSGTFQFALDARDASLYRVAVPNDGALVKVGDLGVPFTTGAEASLDISGAADATVLATIRQPGQPRSTLFSVDLSTGLATEIGRIGLAADGPVNAITARVEAAAP